MRLTTLLLGAFVLVSARFAGAADVAPGAPSAPDKARAEAKLEEVAMRLGQRDFAGALRALEAARAAYPSPKLHFNFGLVYRRLDRLGEALEAYEAYLREVPDGDRVAQARAAASELRPQVGGVSIATDVEGARILIDDQERGRTPQRWPFYLAPGSHRVAIVTPDGTRVETVAIAAGETRALTLPVTVRLPAAGVATVPPPAPSPPADRPEVLLTGAAPSADARRARLRTGAFAAGGGAVLALGLGVVSHVAAFASARDFDARFGVPPSNPASPPTQYCARDAADRGGPDCADLHQKGTSRQRWAFVAYGVGAALAATAAILFVKADQRDADPVTVACGVRAELAGCGLVF